MGTKSHFDTLTIRHVLIEERTKKFIANLQHLVGQLDDNIHLTKLCEDAANITPSASTRQLKARRDNLVATISQVDETQPTRPSSVRWDNSYASISKSPQMFSRLKQ
jgi:hypothetical protein